MLSLFFFIVRLCRLISIFRFFSLKNTVIINIMVYKKSPNQQKMAKSTIFIISKVFLVQSFTENT